MYCFTSEKNYNIIKYIPKAKGLIELIIYILATLLVNYIFYLICSIQFLLFYNKSNLSYYKLDIKKYK